MPLPPVTPADPLVSIGRFARLNTTLPLLVTPEWRRVRAAQAAATPFEGPARHTAVVPTYRQIAGRTVRFAEAGDPDKPTVLFLSPLPFTLLTFELAWRALADDAHLVAFDVPGLGKSPGGPEVMRYDVSARYLLDLMADLDLHDVHLVGHDIPSAIVLNAAATDRSRIASLIIGDGPGIDIEATDLTLNGTAVSRLFDWGPAYRAAIGRLGAPTFVGLMQRLGQVRMRTSAVEVADQLEAYGDGRLTDVMTWFSGAIDGIRTYVDPHLDDLDVPVQILWGADDVVVLEEMGRELDRRLPRSTFTSIPDAGHAPWADQPEVYADLVRSWIADGHRQLS